MKKIKILLMLVVSILLSINLFAGIWGKTVRGNGKVVKQIRAASSFTGINASAGVHVYLFAGNEEKVVVEADENLLSHVVTKFDGQTLKCYVEGNVLSSSKLNVYVNYKKLNNINVSSGANVLAETIVVSDNLNLGASSGADLKIEVDAATVQCNVSSGADAKIKGKTNHFKGEASSGGEIDAAELTVKTCDASASSAGDVKVTVTEGIDANASSGGNISFYGNPAKQKVSESSGGDVTRR